MNQFMNQNKTKQNQKGLSQSELLYWFNILEQHELNAYFLCQARLITQDDGSVSKKFIPATAYTKKEIIHLGRSPSSKRKLEVLQEHNTNVEGLFLYTGVTSNLTILDLDSKESATELLSSLHISYDPNSIPSIDQALLSLTSSIVRTRRGYHLYFQYCKDLCAGPLKNIKADILTSGKLCFSVPCNIGYNLLDDDPSQPTTAQTLDNYVEALARRPILADPLLNYLKNTSRVVIRPDLPSQTQTQTLLSFNETKVPSVDKPPFAYVYKQLKDFLLSPAGQARPLNLPVDLAQRLQISLCTARYPKTEWMQWKELGLRHDFATNCWSLLHLNTAAASLTEDERVDFFNLLFFNIIGFDKDNRADQKEYNNIVKYFKFTNQTIQSYDPNWKETSPYLLKKQAELDNATYEQQVLNNSYLIPIDPNKKDFDKRWILYKEPPHNTYFFLDTRYPPREGYNPVEVVKSDLKGFLQFKGLQMPNNSEACVLRVVRTANLTRNRGLYYEEKYSQWYFNTVKTSENAKLVIDLAHSREVASLTHDLQEKALAEPDNPLYQTSEQLLQKIPYTNALIQNISRRNPEVVKYLYNYLATLLKAPQAGDTALVFKDIGGTGKTLFLDLIELLIGRNLFRRVSRNEFMSNFNGFLEGALVVALDEGVQEGDYRSLEAFRQKVKEVVANKEISVISKHGKGRQITNTANIIITTNMLDNVLSSGTITRRANEFTTSGIALKKIEPFASAYLEGLSTGRNVSFLELLESEIPDLLNYLASLPLNINLFNTQIITEEAEAAAEESGDPAANITKAFLSGDIDTLVDYVELDSIKNDVRKALTERHCSFVFAKEINLWFADNCTRRIKNLLNVTDVTKVKKYKTTFKGVTSVSSYCYTFLDREHLKEQYLKKTKADRLPCSEVKHENLPERFNKPDVHVSPEEASPARAGPPCTSNPFNVSTS